MKNLTNSYWYWFAVLVFGVLLEAVALVYQYYLDYGPCVLCIHVRMLIAAIVLVATLMLWGRKVHVLRISGQLIVTIALIVLAERSWQLLATERGWTIGSCEMTSGLPSWLAFEHWMPWLFRIEEPCGYTPDLPFGVTMAETLIVMMPVLALIAIFVTGALLFEQRE